MKRHANKSVMYWVCLYIVLLSVLCALMISIDEKKRARNERNVIEDAIGTRYVYAFDMGGEMWYAAYDGNVVTIDTDGMKLLKNKK